MIQEEERIIQEVPQDDSTTREEKMILHEAILKTKPKVIVETGTHRGKTTLYMLDAVRQNGVGHIHTYDPYEWGQRGNFRKFPELETLVTYYQERGDSCQIRDIDFAFIDGYHEKKEVLSEMRQIFPRLTKGAHVYFHDTNGSNAHCDVPGAIKEYGIEVEWIKTLNGMARYIHNV